jgi:hypothetical protein
VLSSVAGLAKKTVDLTTSATVSTLKGSGKAAFYLVSPKHVTRREVWGVWRLDQQRKLLFKWCCCSKNLFGINGSDPFPFLP